MNFQKEKKLESILKEEFCLSNLEYWGLNTLEKIKINIVDESIKRHNGEYIEPINITSSSGFVLVIIFPDFVLKIFNDLTTLNKVVTLIKSGINSPHIINLIDVIEKNNFYAIITNKLIPLTNWNDNYPVLNYNLGSEEILLTLLYQTGLGLELLHNNYFTHGDCTLDNIGIYNDKFMLFDFNMGKIHNSNTKSDIDSLLKSINNKNELKSFSSNIISFLKQNSINNGSDLIYYIKKYCTLNRINLSKIYQLIPLSQQ